jgi:uncharacterized membrane protein (UPF0127 family)
MTRTRATLGGHPLTLWVPETSAERTWGLQGLATLPDSDAMLFLEGPVWMANLTFPIDIVEFALWPATRLNAAVRVVTAVWPSVRPGDERHYGRRETSVLELAADWCARRNIYHGATVEIAEDGHS